MATSNKEPWLTALVSSAAAWVVWHLTRRSSSKKKKRNRIERIKKLKKSYCVDQTNSGDGNFKSVDNSTKMPEISKFSDNISIPSETATELNYGRSHSIPLPPSPPPLQPVSQSPLQNLNQHRSKRTNCRRKRNATCRLSRRKDTAMFYKILRSYTAPSPNRTHQHRTNALSSSHHRFPRSGSMSMDSSEYVTSRACSQVESDASVTSSPHINFSHGQYRNFHQTNSSLSGLEDTTTSAELYSDHGGGRYYGRRSISEELFRQQRTHLQARPQLHQNNTEQKYYPRIPPPCHI